MIPAGNAINTPTSRAAAANCNVAGSRCTIRRKGQRGAIRIEFFGDEVERVTELDPLTGEVLAEFAEHSTVLDFTRPHFSEKEMVAPFIGPFMAPSPQPVAISKPRRPSW